MTVECRSPDEICSRTLAGSASYELTPHFISAKCQTRARGECWGFARYAVIFEDTLDLVFPTNAGFWVAFGAVDGTGMGKTGI